MGRVHTASYKRALEHFPDLGVRPRLVVAADVSADRRRHAELMGFERSVDDWRAVVEDPAVDVISVTTPNALHREIATAVVEAGKPVWVEKPVGRRVEETVAVAEAAARAGVVNAVGFCYRFAPAVAHARELVAAGAIGEINHYRGVFLADYANRPDAAASWRFFREDSGSGVLGDLMAHVVDLTHFLVGPIERLTGRTATMIPKRPRLDVGVGTHFSRVETDDLVDVENEDWAGALFEFEGGTLGSLEASRVVVGPRVRLRFEVHGTEGALAWELERMNELERSQLPADGADEGYANVFAGPGHGEFGAFQPGAGIPMGYDDLRVTEARNFLAAVRDGEQRGPGLSEMVATAHVLQAIERSSASGAWEPAREPAAVGGATR
jgi:predicted dehydrogenase